MREVGVRCLPSDDLVAGVKDLLELIDDVKDVHPGPETDFQMVHEKAGELSELEKREGGKRLSPPEELGNKKRVFVRSHRDHERMTVDKNAAEVVLVGRKKVEFLQG
jgi:hypothetical protein